jgi:hypothetical protein
MISPRREANPWRYPLQDIYDASYDRNKSLADIGMMVGKLQMIADQESEWIPCSAKMPDDGRRRVLRASGNRLQRLP